MSETDFHATSRNGFLLVAKAEHTGGSVVSGGDLNRPVRRVWQGRDTAFHPYDSVRNDQDAVGADLPNSEPYSPQPKEGFRVMLLEVSSRDLR